MKKLDFIRYMGNINEKYVIESENYKPVSRNWIKITAIAACIAVLVTSIPLSFILNRDDNSTKVQDKNEITDDIINIPGGDDNVLQSYENIQLKDGTLVLNAIKLSNGKIVSDLSETRPYVFDYTAPTEEELAEMRSQMIQSAFKYHDPRYSSYPTTVQAIGSANYSVSSSKYTVSKGVHCNNYDNYDSISSDRFVWDGRIYIPENATGEYMYNFFQKEINRLGEIFQKNFDSYRIYYEDELFPVVDKTLAGIVCLWDSSDTEINDRIEKLGNKMFNPNGSLSEDYEEMLGLTVQIHYYGAINREIRHAYVTYADEIYTPLENEALVSKLDYLSLNIGGRYYRCGSSDEELYACSTLLEQYLIDVFGINGLTDEYEVTDSLYDDLMATNGEIGKKTVTIREKSTQDYQNAFISLIFETLDGELYYLTGIGYRYSIAEGIYLELISEEGALYNLMHGYCIGSVGQFKDGCRLCYSKHQIPMEERIPEGLECSLVYIPDVIFISGDKSITYDMPFYAFTVPGEKEGEYLVAYVPAVHVDGLSEVFSERNKAECAYMDHSTGRIREGYDGAFKKPNNN